MKKAALIITLICAIHKPPQGVAQGWTEITPSGLDEISQFRSFEFDGHVYEIFVWGNLTGYRFDSNQQWDSILVHFRSYYCPQGAWEEHYLTEVAKGGTDADITLCLYIESGCITECITGMYRDTTGFPSNENRLHSLGDLVCAGICADLVFSPFDGNTVYLTFADSVYRSTDQGGTFAALSSPSPDPYAFFPVLTTLALSPFDPNIVFTSTLDTLYRSSDGGFTWSRALYLGINEWLGVNAVKFHPSDSLVVYAACDSGMWKSTDEGMTWVRMLSGGFECLEVYRDELTGIFAGRNDGKLLWSSDEGQSWNIFNDTFSSSRIYGIQRIPESDTLIVAASDGIFKVYDSFVLSANEQAGQTPQEINLFQNYPNPFNPKTDIGFQISDYRWVKLVVFDLLGCEVATLVNEQLPPGRYSRQWDASGVASGVYYYRLTAGHQAKTKRMILIR